jgi:hypothetical protein
MTALMVGLLRSSAPIASAAIFWLDSHSTTHSLWNGRPYLISVAQ